MGSEIKEFATGLMSPLGQFCKRTNSNEASGRVANETQNERLLSEQFPMHRYVRKGTRGSMHFR